MRPLDPLSGMGELEALLSSGSVSLVRTELVRLEDSTLDDHAVVALLFARGELALRVGSLDEAHGFLRHAADGYRDLGEREAEALSRIEGHIAIARRGPRAASQEAETELSALGASAPSERVAAACDLGRGIAARSAGDLATAHDALAAAMARTEEMPDVRVRVLSELAQLYLASGATGGARSLLVRAAELARRLGHAVLELGAHRDLARVAALRGELGVARRHWLRCEVIADAIDDIPARVESLSQLSEVASQWERHGDALELARTAMGLVEGREDADERAAARAARALARATMELGDEGAAAYAASARERFERVGDRLGEALARWDEAALADRARPAAGAEAGWFEAAWSLATLGEVRRVLELLSDRAHSRGEREPPEAEDRARLVLADRFAEHGELVESELAAERPARLVSLCHDRADAHRNVARLCVACAAPEGLVLAAIAGAAIGVSRDAYPPATAAAVLVGQLPGVCVWAWRPPHHGSVVARDLSALRATIGGPTRAVVVREAHAKITSPGFGVGASVEGADVGALCLAALSATAGALVLRAATAGSDALDWDAECDVIVRMAGFTVAR